MEFSILGPLAVRLDGVDVAPTAGKPRALLVRLLVAGGRPVTADRLIDDLWDGDPPRSGAQTLQTYILQIRKAVGADRLVTDGGGYRLVVHHGELDAAVFESAVEAGGEAMRRGATSEAIGSLQRALQLWRGTPLADASGPAWAQGEAARLDELRLVAQELLLEAKLAAGQHAEVVAVAEAAVAEHPLRERLWAHLITALYRQGRQAEALRAFQRLRMHLADELGIDPSPELRELERAVLEQDPRLAVASPRVEPVAAPTMTLPSGLVTFLLTDVVGSTRLWDTVPLLMPDALALHDAAIRNAVESHGGVVLKARGEGDSVFAVFRRATDAANAAVAAQHVLRSLDWPDGCVLSVRMAVHTGEALERDGDYYGPTVNRAARLRSLATSGQIIVSNASADVIVDHLRPEVRLVELGPQQLRDLERPETVYLLVDADTPSEPARGSGQPAAPSPFEPPALPSPLAASGPFVGREQEIERLVAEWERAQHGGPRVVMLGGEPGVGKTRLAAEAARRVHEHGGIVLYGRCDEELGAPYQPFTEALRLLLPSLDASRLRAVRGVEELARLVPQVAHVVPDLPAPTHSDPDTERYALFDTVAGLFVAVSQERPILIVLDDLHWANKPTLLMLRHVLRFSEGARLQLLGTYRTTDLDPNHPLAAALADLHREGTAERLVLAGLDETDVTALLEATGHDDDELARTLSTVTSGNPFFLIEVLRHVEETGGGWDPGTLPQGVREAVGRRLSRLTDPTREALLAGAVAGARFSLALVEAVLERDLVDAVEEACDAGILVEEPGGHLRFNHALVRQSLLTGVASVKRLRLHQHIAETLEASGGDTDEHLADLAHHYFESAWAGNAAKAVEYCRRAADQAMARLAYEGAAELYEWAVQALDVHDVGGRDSARAELLLACCEAHLAAGDAAGAADVLAGLERVAGDSRPLAAWVVCFEAQLAVLTHPDRLDHMERRVASAADEFASLGDAAGEAVAHNTRASCLARLGRFADCELALDRALTAARRSTESAADHRRVNAVLAGAPSAALWGPNPVARAGGRCLDVIRLLRITTGSPAVEATSVRCQAMLEAFRGRTQAARRMLDSARRSLTELGLRHALLEVDLYAGMVELLADDAPAAAAHLRRAYDGFNRMGLDADAAEAAALLASARLALGEDDEAERLCVESERLGGQDLRASIAWRTVRAELLARRGEHERAREFALAAVALAEPTDALVDQGDSYLALAVVLEAAGDHAGAAEAAARAIALYERKGATALAERARAFASPAAASSSAAPRGEDAPSWLRSDAFIAFSRRFNELFAARAWDELVEVMEPDVCFDNRRRLVLEPSFHGVPAYGELLRTNAAEVGYRGTLDRVVATRGPSLALVHTTAVGRGDQPDAPGEDILRVMQLSSSGRLINDVVFDIEDLDAAYSELDERYLRAEGAEHTEVFRPIAAAVDAYNQRDPSSAPMASDLTAIDHRATSVAPIGGGALLTAFEQAMAQLPDSTLRVAAVHALHAGGAVVTTIQRGSTPDGAVVEATFHGVHVVEDGLIRRVELFPEPDLDAALAQFRDVEVGSSGAPRPTNLASSVLSHIYSAVECQDWSTVATLVAADFVGHDRRWSAPRHGRDELLESFRVSFELVDQRPEATTLATRGDHLSLTGLRMTGRRESEGAVEIEALVVAAVDGRGLLTQTVTFEPGDIDAASAELDARYIAGEGAPYAATLAPVFAYNDARKRQLDRSRELMAEDVTFVDHRTALSSRAEGRDAVAEAVAPNPDERSTNVAIEAIDHGVVLMAVHAIATSAEGVDAEWSLRLVWMVEDGLVKRFDVFDSDDLAAARATFDELRRAVRPSSIAGNAATAAFDRLHNAYFLEDWPTVMSLLAEDAVCDDRRPDFHYGFRGRDLWLEQFQAMASIGVKRLDSVTLATRGQQLALARVRGGGLDARPTAPDVETLNLMVIGDDGSVREVVVFDPGEIDTAFAELNARYLAGEGAPFAATLVPTLEAVEVRSRDRDRWTELLADDVTFVDRRPAAFGAIHGRDAVLETFDHRWSERGHVVAIEAVDDGVVLTLDGAAGVSAHGMEAEWLLLVLRVVEDGQIKRVEVFDGDDATAARAMFEQLCGRGDAWSIDGNMATATWARYQDACGRRDWPTVEAALAEDVVLEDRRSGVHVRTAGSAAAAEVARSMAAVGIVRFDRTILATRGTRLALVRTRGSGREQGPGAPALEVLDVVEVDADGLLVATAHFDVDDLDAAFDELDARYLAGVGAPFEATLTSYFEYVTALMRDRERSLELVAENGALVDHRLASFGAIEGREAIAALLRQRQAATRQDVLTIEAIDHRVLLCILSTVGTTEDGAAVEWRFYCLAEIRDGLLARAEMFDLDDRAGALAAFEQLRSRMEPSPTLDNDAAAVFRLYEAACAQHDWAAAERLLAPDITNDDRRSGAQLRLDGRAAVLEAMRSVAKIGVVRFDHTTVATRGSRLALLLTRGSGREQGEGAPALEVLDVVEIDANGQVAGTVTFDVEDLDAAYAELNARYLAGEGAPFADTLRPYFDYLAERVRDPERSVELVADDITVVDHRLASFGVIEGRDAFVGALLRQFATAGTRHHVLTIEAIDHGLLLGVLNAVGTSEDGVAVEWLLHNVCAVKDGLLTRVELFELEDRAGALAAFEQLRGRVEPSPTLDNDAAAVLRLCEAASGRRDWAAVEMLLAADVVADDRRSGVRLRLEGRGAVVDAYRSGAELNVTLDHTTLATRGSRLALVRVRACVREQAPGGPALEVLDVVELDRHGRLASIVVLDVEDLDAAFDELDTRYLAGEGAPHAATIGPVLQCTQASSRDWERYVALHAEDVVVVDHRPASFGVIEGRDLFLSTLEPWSLEQMHVLAVEALELGAVMVLLSAHAKTGDGLDVEWLFHLIGAVDRGVITRWEIFEAEQRAAALEVFEQLRTQAPSSPVTANAAAVVLSQYHAAALEQDWPVVESLLAEETVADDRRSGVQLRLEGRAAVTDLMRGVIGIGVVAFDRSTVATRGARLALVWVRASGRDGGAGAPQADVLHVAELDADGRIAAVITFDGEDRDAAFDELDARYLAGEGAPYADALVPTLAIREMWSDGSGRWIDLMAEGVVFIDHRSAAFGAVEGRENLAALLRRDWETRNEIIEVEAVDSRASLHHLRAAGESPGGANVEWDLHELFVVEHGFCTRIEVFDLEDRPAALDAFERLRQPARVSTVPDNTAARALAAFLDACLRGEWAEARDLAAEDLVMDDLRSEVQLHGVGRDGWIAAHRFGVEAGVTRFETTTVATRGDRLVLSHLWCGTDARGAAPVFEMLQVVETDARGQIVGSVGFDAHDLDSAFAELDRRYLAGDGAPYASSLAVVLECVEGPVTGPEQWQKLATDDMVFVDHRPAAFGVVEGRAGVIDIMREPSARRSRAVAVERLAHGIVLVLQRIEGKSDDGGDVEWLMHNLFVVEGGLVKRSEVFALDDLDDAVARFEQLRPSRTPSPIAENLATTTLRRLHDASLRGEWDAAAALLAEDVVGDDRRSGLRQRPSGREAAIAAYRFGAEMGVTRYETTPIATRGERLALTHLWCGADGQPGAPTGELLFLVETNNDGQIVGTVSFDVDDLDSAFAELDRRYLAGDGAPHAATLAVMLDGLDSVARDRDRWESLLAEDVVLVDHRPAAFGLVEGRPAFIRLMQEHLARRARIVAVERVDHGVLLALVNIVGVSNDGVDVEWLFHDLSVVADGVATCMELFGLDDLDAALARFDELRSPRISPVTGNLATATLSALLDACLRGDWAAAGALLAEDVSGPDHRSGIPFGTEGRDATLGGFRFGVEQGATRFDATTIATRGERLALSTFSVGGRSGETVIEMLNLVETDTAGLVTTHGAFDIDDVDGAFAELDRRYLEGEGRPYAATLAPVLSTSAAWRDGRWTDLVDHGVVVVDHRLAAFGVVQGREALARLLHTHWTSRLEIVTVEAMRHGVAVVRSRVTAESADGIAAEWVIHQVDMVEDGLITRMELFADDDLGAARRRFDELRLAAGVARAKENTAARVHRREYAAVLEGRWHDLEDLIAEDILFEDRRSVIRMVTRGRAGFIEQCRLSIEVGFRRGITEVVATRGDRLVLCRVTAATGDTEVGGAENVSLFLTEVDESGRVIAAIGFDVNDLDSAFAELEARYAAGEAASSADTWLAVVEVYRRFNSGRGKLRWPAAPVEVSAFADIPGVQARVMAVHGLGEGVAFLSVSASAPDAEGWEWLVVLTVGDGRTNNLETYATDDFDVALARFEELASAG